MLNRYSLQILALLTLLLAGRVHALEAVSDDDLAQVAGQSGLTLMVTGNTTTSGGFYTNGVGSNASSNPTMVHVNPDYGNPTACTSTCSADLLITGYQLLPVGAGGVQSTTPLQFTLQADTGADASGTGFGLAASWTRMRTQYSYLSLCTGDFTSCPQRTASPNSSPATAQAFGELDTDNSGQFTLATSRGLFYTSATLDANMLLRLTIGPNSGGVGTGDNQTAFKTYQTASATSTSGYGQLYFAPGATGGATPPAELLLDNIYLDTGIAPGQGGLLGVCTTSNSSCGYTSGSVTNKFAPTTTPVSGQQNYAGMYFVTPELDFNMTFAFNFLGNPSAAFTSSSSLTSFTPVNYFANSCNSTSTSPVCNIAIWGWTGSFSGTGGSGSSGNSGAGLLIGGGGAWTAPAAGSTYSPDTPANRTNGLNIAFRGNFYNGTGSGNLQPFTWYVGRAGGVLSFGNWVTLQGYTNGGTSTAETVPWSLNAPNITLDVVNPSQGPGGLCWGADIYGGSTACAVTYNKPIIKSSSTLAITGQYLDTNKSTGSCTASPCNSVSSTEPALALLVRNLSLQAYSTQVQILDDVNLTGSFTDGVATCNYTNESNCTNVTKGSTTYPVPKTQTEPWTLMYTLGQLDANIYLYPGNGTATGTNNGLTTDILLMTQSFGSTSNPDPLIGNSNFMIGETCTPGGATPTGANCGMASGASYWNGTTPAWCSPSCTLAVGLTEADLLFAANQLHLNLNGNSTTYNYTYGSSVVASPTYGPGIQFKTTDFRDQINGLFSGGLLSGSNSTYSTLQPGTATSVTTVGENLIVASYIDLNLESNSADITFSPQLTSYNGPSGSPYSYIGLAGHMTLISPGAANNTTNVGGTAPSASTIDMTPSGFGSCTAGPSGNGWYYDCGTNVTNDGTYFSLAEPTTPTSNVRFADIQGDVTILPCQTSAVTGCGQTSGTLHGVSCSVASPCMYSPTPSQVFLSSGGDPSFVNDDAPRLRVAVTAVLGTSPGGTIGAYGTGGGEPLSTIVKFGGSPLGTIVIPSAQIYSSVTLRPQ